MKKTMLLLVLMLASATSMMALPPNWGIDFGYSYMGSDSEYDVDHGMNLEFSLTYNLIKNDRWIVNAGVGVYVSEATTNLDPEVTYASKLLPVFIRPHYILYTSESQIKYYVGCQVGYDFSLLQDRIVEVKGQNADLHMHDSGYYNRGFSATPSLGLSYNAAFLELGYKYHYTDMNSGYSIGAYMFRFGILM